eukprot:445362-Ditylum_brightwellii.AAC.1
MFTTAASQNINQSNIPQEPSVPQGLPTQQQVHAQQQAPVTADGMRQMYVQYPPALFYQPYHQLQATAPPLHSWNAPHKNYGQGGNQLSGQSIQMTEHSEPKVQNAEASAQEK